ncbi:MAG: hypothetical protein ACRD0N_06900 [Acidimicrobiales bacterium]
MTTRGEMETAGDMARTDRLLAPTFWTAVCIVPVLTAAFVILYLMPGRTKALWAWEIKPDMSALVMGGGYISGAYLFFRVARDKRWHRVGVAFLGTTVFTTVLLGATVLHWDRFNHDHVSFWAWLALYVVTPPLLPWLWLRNRQTDPGTLEERDVVVPRALRTWVAIGGTGQLCVAAAMFLFPEDAADVWPWTVTPLTARSLSAYVAWPAVAWLAFAWEERWSCYRVALQTATVGLVLVGLGALRARDDFTGSDRSVAFFVFALVTSIVLLIVLQVAMERRVRAQAGNVHTLDTVDGAES